MSIVKLIRNIKINKVIILLSLLFTGCASTYIVDRAYDETPILIRSPQPDESDIRSLHKKYELATVLNLRGADIPSLAAQRKGEKPPDWWVREKKVCRELGIRLWTFNLGDGTSPPTTTDINLFFAILQKRVFWPILIHCQGGIHRTGLMVALYRIQFQGWPAPTAIEEMESHWYNWSISDRSKVKEFLRYYRQDPSRQLPR